ncbi:MAG: hypothetical protein WC046_00115 [Candidatus Bathyarchaeia archaeon]
MSMTKKEIDALLSEVKSFADKIRLSGNKEVLSCWDWLIADFALHQYTVQVTKNSC